MKILKIENGKGLYYSIKNSNYCELNNISAEEILDIVKFILDKSNSDIENDAYDETLIKNEAQKVIYNNLSIKLTNLINNKVNILEQIDNDFNDLYKKYN